MTYSTELKALPEYMDTAVKYAHTKCGRFVLYKESHEFGRLRGSHAHTPWILVDLQPGAKKRTRNFDSKKNVNCCVVHSLTGQECAPWFGSSAIPCPKVTWVRIPPFPSYNKMF